MMQRALAAALLADSPLHIRNLTYSNDANAALAVIEALGATVVKKEWQLIEARLDLAKGKLRQSFTTRNRLDSPKSIHMELVEGPFSRFDGRWFFQSLSEDACKVILDLQFTVSNKLVGMAARRLFDSVSNNMVDAVCQRANTIYGK